MSVVSVESFSYGLLTLVHGKIILLLKSSRVIGGSYHGLLRNWKKQVNRLN